jgi:hypothetical protein
LRNWPVIAMRQSVSMLTLRTPCLMPRTISSTGTPKVCGISPPKALMMSCSSCGTDEEPCMTRCVFGILRWIASITFIARMSPSGLRRELVGAVRGAAGNRQRVDLGAQTKSTAWSGSVSSWSWESLPSAPEPSSASASPVSSEPSTPSSPSTEAPTQWAIRATAFGDLDIVVVGRRRLHVGFQRAVHHHRGEAVADRGHAGGFVVAVVLVHADRDIRIHLGQRVDHRDSMMSPA